MEVIQEKERIEVQGFLKHNPSVRQVMVKHCSSSHP